MTKWVCSDMLNVRRDSMQVYKTYKSFYAVFENNVFSSKIIKIKRRTKTNKYVMFALKKILLI